MPIIPKAGRGIRRSLINTAEPECEALLLPVFPGLPPQALVFMSSVGECYCAKPMFTLPTEILN